LRRVSQDISCVLVMVLLHVILVVATFLFMVKT
jgi:hypothetical protein